MGKLYIYVGEEDDQALAMGNGTIPKWVEKGPQPEFDITDVPESKHVTKRSYFIREEPNSPPGIKCTLLSSHVVPGQKKTLKFRREQ